MDSSAPTPVFPPDPHTASPIAAQTATRIIDEGLSRDYAQQCRLSVLIRENRISYAVFDPERNKFLAFHAAYFRQAGETHLLEALRDTLPGEELLHMSFQSVRIGLGYRPAVPVPISLYDESTAGDNLHLQGLLHPGEHVHSDRIDELNAIVEYAIEPGLYRYLQGIFGDPEIRHATSGLLAATAQGLPHSGDVVFLHVHREQFAMLTYRDGHLLMVNHFPFFAKEDFIYYIVAACQEMGIDRESADFVILGEAVEQSALYEIAYKYLRNVRFGKRPEGFRYHRDIREMPGQFNFNLYALQLCV